MRRKIIRTMFAYKAQFISMLIMIALGTGIFVGFNMEWVSIDTNTRTFFSETGFADFRIYDEDGFSEEEADRISSEKGVAMAARYTEFRATVKGESGDELAVTVTEKPDISGFVTISGEKYDLSSENGIWLSDKYAKANGFSIGDTIELKYDRETINGTVKGLVKSGEHLICIRDETQLMPDYDTFGFAYISPKMYEDSVNKSIYMQINVISDLSDDEFNDMTDRVLERTVMVIPKEDTIAYSESQGESKEGKTMGSVLPVLFLLIAILTMTTTMNRITVNEKVQIGTLRALGFPNRRIAGYYTSIACIIGIIGSILGIAIGYPVAFTIMNPNGSMGTYLDMKDWELHLPLFCCVILACIVLIITLVGYNSVKKVLRGNVVDTLQPYVEVNTRHLKAENIILWQRLRFGSKWNLRDLFRHKARTSMSLLGTAACTLIIVCALGMNDTMNAFIDDYYNESINYTSRIYLSDEATAKEQMDLYDHYGPDFSCSMNVKLNHKAVSLDVYYVPDRKVKFPAKGGGFIDIEDEGAYICSRIAKEFKLKEGDSFSIKPYGSDDKYTLKVAGITRSITENIVISPQYAEKKDIPVWIDSIYSIRDEKNIEKEDSIKSIQTKETVIKSFDTFMEIMYVMVIILIIGAVIMGLVVLYNLGVMSYTERYREMATLKVLGFNNRQIGKLMITQNLWISICGILIGLLAGKGALAFLISLLASEYELRTVVYPLTYVLSIVITLIISMGVGYLVARKNRKIEMTEALGTIE